MIRRLTETLAHPAFKRLSGEAFRVVSNLWNFCWHTGTESCPMAGTE